MKKQFLLCCALSAAALFPALPARAQLPATSPTPASGGNPFLDDKKNTTENLHAAITKQPYTFLAGSYTMHLTFHSNGTGEEEDWKFKWHAKDAQTVELSQLGTNGQPNGKKTTLTFTSDYSSYTGFHFDGIMKVSGHVVEKH